MYGWSSKQDNSAEISNNYRYKLLHVMVITPARYGDHSINIFTRYGSHRRIFHC